MSARFETTDRVIEKLFDALPVEIPALRRSLLRLDLEELLDREIEDGIRAEAEDAYPDGC